MITARYVIDLLGLTPHPEGGWYREMWRSSPYLDGRSAGTAIYFLLESDRPSAWHRVDADEIWHYYLGAPLTLTMQLRDGERRNVLGPDLGAEQRPQIVVPAGIPQSASTFGPWTLCGCTVAPGFTFEGFELIGNGPTSGPEHAGPPVA
jgi:predicted cupin superfamily sugar epimerase